jgi:hypothetical protein
MNGPVPAFTGLRVEDRMSEIVAHPRNGLRRLALATLLGMYPAGAAIIFGLRAVLLSAEVQPGSLRILAVAMLAALGLATWRLLGFIVSSEEIAFLGDRVEIRRRPSGRTTVYLYTEVEAIEPPHPGEPAFAAIREGSRERFGAGLTEAEAQYLVELLQGRFGRRLPTGLRAAIEEY